MVAVILNGCVLSKPASRWCTSGICLFVKGLLSGICQVYIPVMGQECAHDPAGEDKQPGCSKLHFAKKEISYKKVKSNTKFLILCCLILKFRQVQWNNLNVRSLIEKQTKSGFAKHCPCGGSKTLSNTSWVSSVSVYKFPTIEQTHR